MFDNILADFNNFFGDFNNINSDFNDIKSLLLANQSLIIDFLSQSYCIVLFAFLFEMFIPIPKALRISAFNETFLYLGKKVNKPTNKKKKKTFAGIILPLMIIIVFLFISLLFGFIADFDIVISFMLLILVLETRPAIKDATKIYKLLRKNQKEDARTYLQTMVLRDCDNLSTMGICKAACENIILRMFINFAIICWFVVCGFTGAIIMRLCYELCRTYNKKLSEYKDFGIGIYRITQAMLAIPAYIFSMFFLLSVKTSFITSKRVSTSYYAYISGIVLGLVGSNLNIQLGGPRYYKGEFVRYDDIGGMQNPRDISILKSMRKMRFTTLMLILILISLQSLINYFLY